MLFVVSSGLAAAAALGEPLALTEVDMRGVVRVRWGVVEERRDKEVAELC